MFIVYLGVSLYSILFEPFLRLVSPTVFTFISNSSPVSPSLADLDLSTLQLAQTKFKNSVAKPSSRSTPILIVSAPPSSLLKRKRTTGDMLADELADQIDPLLVGNKRREVDAKRSLDMHRAVKLSDSIISEILQEASQKVKEDVSATGELEGGSRKRVK